MQAYRDNPFGDSQPNPQPGGFHDPTTLSGHQYPAGFQPIPPNPNYSTMPSSESAANLAAGGEAAKSGSDRTSQWLATEHAHRSRRSKIIVIGGIILLIVIIVVAVTVGVVVSRSRSQSQSANSNSRPSSDSTTNAVNQTDPNDPSTFVKDPNLHQAFYGIAYTPVGSQLPDCGNKLEDVIQDVQLLSQLTKRIRLYGADCNQSALVLEAIRQTKVDLTVFLGNYVVPTDNNAAYNRQKETLRQAIETYGVDHVGGITVGNEFMLNYLNANGGGTDANGPVGNAGAQLLIANIRDTVDMLNGMSLSKHIPVGNADAGFFFNNQVLGAVEYGMANVHPWFANVSVDTSAAWTFQFFQETNVDAANALSNRPQMSIAETGWPSKSSDAGNANNGASTASEENLQKFIDSFVCAANANNVAYYFFEFADEDWKDKQFGGVEGWWGLFNQNRTLKNIKIPTCTAP